MAQPQQARDQGCPHLLHLQKLQTCTSSCLPEHAVSCMLTDVLQYQLVHDVTPQPLHLTQRHSFFLILCRFDRDMLELIDNQGRAVLLDVGPFVLINLYGPAVTNADNERFAYKLALYQVRLPQALWSVARRQAACSQPGRQHALWLQSAKRLAGTIAA